MLSDMKTLLTLIQAKFRNTPVQNIEKIEELSRNVTFFSNFAGPELLFENIACSLFGHKSYKIIQGNNSDHSWLEKI